MKDKIYCPSFHSEQDGNGHLRDHVARCGHCPATKLIGTHKSTPNVHDILEEIHPKNIKTLVVECEGSMGLRQGASVAEGILIVWALQLDAL